MTTAYKYNYDSREDIDKIHEESPEAENIQIKKAFEGIKPKVKYISTETEISNGEEESQDLLDFEKFHDNVIPLHETFLKINSQKQDPFKVLQRWEGYILNIKDNAFIARLIDLTNHEPDEEAEFDIEEIEDEDIDLLREGAVFYWNIGYNDTSSGRKRVSFIRFRRLPAWNKEELKETNIYVERIKDKLKWGKSSTSNTTK